jgi:ABC-type bacteriocin/lantibiotic exporter with double-glycine peptidase domain
MNKEAPPYATNHSSFISLPAWRFLGRFFKGKKGTLIFTTLFTAASFLTILPSLWLVRYAFDSAIPEKAYQNLIYVALALIGIRLLNNGLALYLRTLNVKVVTSSIYQLRVALLQQVTELSRKYHQSQDYRVLQTRLVQDTERISQAVLNLVSSFLPAVVGATVLFVVLFSIHWPLTLIISLGAPLVYAVNRYMKKHLKNRIFGYQRAFEEFSKGNFFLLRFMDLIKVSAAVGKELKQQAHTVDHLRGSTYQRVYTNALYTQILSLIAGTIAAVILAVGGIAVAQGQLTLGAFLAFYMAANFLNQQLTQITSSFNLILTGNESLLTLHKIMGSPALPEYQGKKTPALQGGFSLEEVAFAYHQEQYVFEKVNLHIKPQEVLALVGPNGAGKSTLVNLLLGIYKPSKGRLKADGYPYEDLQMEHLRNHIGMVFQQAYLVPGTIAENIAYGLGERKQEELEAAAKMALAHDFIMKLDKGYQALTGEDGVFLSGGERQRIAIARALLRKPKLLILDEPTNHLDAQAIETIMQNVTQHFKQTSVLLISHNQEVISYAHRVVELKNKRLSPKA